ncbi:Vacuolar protein-sorting-associated protein 28 [Malassezia cuniculi]|uniref:Vacuolar protein sorting-associated protein 28 n=1 Tax=Malassezia cuniculi TaxID=948313 RepID=A0AAF0ESW4_9BASI|nr:Vacuolar protein-sorting-associated protein 28 [Malassezia cuniculi]
MSVNVYEEQRLYTSGEERETYEGMATLYSNIVCLDQLERVYVRGDVQDDEYASACTRLIGQCKTATKLLSEPHGGVSRFSDITSFMKQYGMDMPAAAHRLQVGVPATVEHAQGSTSSAEHARCVAETTQNFITLMDALKLKMHAKDQLHPLLSDLLASYTRVARGAGAGASRERLLHWLIELNKMGASARNAI